MCCVYRAGSKQEVFGCVAQDSAQVRDHGRQDRCTGADDTRNSDTQLVERRLAAGDGEEERWSP